MSRKPGWLGIILPIGYYFFGRMERKDFSIERTGKLRCILHSFLIGISGALLFLSQSSLQIARAESPRPTWVYTIKPSESKFKVKARSGGVLGAFGHDHNISIRNFSGSAKLTPETINPASVRIQIEPDSLVVEDEVSPEDREQIENTMRDEVLETSKYPGIVFESISLSVKTRADNTFHVSILGDLLLHGTSRPIIVDAEVTLIDTLLIAKGRFSLSQSEYGIQQASILGGTIKVKDKLHFSFDITANREWFTPSGGF